MLHLKRIDHYTVNYPEGQEKELLHFYKDVLYLKQIQNLVPKTFWFAMGEIELHLSIGNTQAKESRHVAFIVEDLEAAKLFLTEKNISIEYSSKIEGRDRFFFRDPFGNRFELIEFSK